VSGTHRPGGNLVVNPASRERGRDRNHTQRRVERFACGRSLLSTVLTWPTA